MRAHQSAWVLRRRATWHFGLLHACCRDPTRLSGRNQQRQMQQGLFRASGMVTHHHLTVQTTLSSTLDYQAGGSLLVSTGGSLLESAEASVGNGSKQTDLLLKHMATWQTGYQTLISAVLAQGHTCIHWPTRSRSRLKPRETIAPWLISCCHRAFVYIWFPAWPLASVIRPQPGPAAKHI